jgi:hypothetical protein
LTPTSRQRLQFGKKTMPPSYALTWFYKPSQAVGGPAYQPICWPKDCSGFMGEASVVTPRKAMLLV